MARWGDEEIFAWCCAEGRVLGTSDKRLTKCLAESRATCPSVIILRDFRTLTSKQVAEIVIPNLPAIGEAIDKHGNTVFTVSPDKPIRGAILPLGLQAR
ncbi:DUF5615 family PIN-like protein [Nonomuraea sp. NPDC050540]|uniref:DUF5615 family PIN-like protein n=1 Tax=Nonomuraea sp. NPDC050540 TaxID=3364367 RepID=UPI0037A96C7E